MNSTLGEAGARDLVERGVTSFRQLLGDEWEVSADLDPHNGGDLGWDAVVRITAADGSFVELMVETKRQVTPKEVETVLQPKASLVRRLNQNTQLVVLAPWISRKAQEVMHHSGIGYLDLTQNVSLRVGRPAIVIHTQGADRAPRSQHVQSKKPLLTGPKAGRLVRLLVDVAPPYRAGELCRRAGLSLPYVSRLLDALEDQLLIRRDGRLITTVDWPELLRTRAQHLNILRHNAPVGMLAPNGVADVLNKLAAAGGRVQGQQVLMTGTHAARSVAPLAVGGQLMLYVPHSEQAPYDVARALGLLPIDETADVIVLRAHDRVVFERPGMADSIPRVALSQLALDCLSGPGRMPAEGEAVLAHMADHEDLWRSSDLSSLEGDHPA